ncbi:MAG: DUF3800 domain-containing protein [Erythrobacter sp.]|nr:DUF3800 domain-containing protein [Erythrobacter sp.]
MYHLYADEIGHTSYHTSNRPNHRYLSVTGVIIDEAAEKGLQDRFDAFRSELVGHTPERPMVLHRSEMGGKKGLGRVLTARGNRAEFEDAFIEFLTQAEITVITVTLDRVGFYYKHEGWTGEPYEMCAYNMFERYCLFLHHRKAQGKVTVEGRNPTEDDKFKAGFQSLCDSGNRFMGSARIRRLLGHTPIAVAGKHEDIMGVQIADFLCQPLLEASIKRFRGKGGTDDFNKRMMHAVWPKLYKSRIGRINGAGLVWRP